MSKTIQISNRKAVVAAVPPAQLAKREAIFCVYRDLGPHRNYRRLQVAIKSTHGSVSPRTLNSWSQLHSWQERCREHDERLAKGKAATEGEPFDPDFDIEEALLHNAQIALNRALKADIAVETPHQQKALIDAAINAVKIVDMRRGGRQTTGEIANSKRKFIEAVQKIEARIRAAHAAEKPIIDVQAEPVEQLKALSVSATPLLREMAKDGPTPP
jgi:hypothetical protein